VRRCGDGGVGGVHGPEGDRLAICLPGRGPDGYLEEELAGISGLISGPTTGIQDLLGGPTTGIGLGREWEHVGMVVS